MTDKFPCLRWELLATLLTRCFSSPVLLSFISFHLSNNAQLSRPVHILSPLEKRSQDTGRSYSLKSQLRVRHPTGQSQVHPKIQSSLIGQSKIWSLLLPILRFNINSSPTSPPAKIRASLPVWDTLCIKDFSKPHKRLLRASLAGLSTVFCSTA